MDGLLFVIVVSLVLVGALFLISTLSGFFARRRAEAAAPSDPEPEPAPETDRTETTDWRSVKIAPGAKRCEYASILTGKVFLIDEAPPLPLVNCHQSDCLCRYVNLDDRRSGIDRRIGVGDPGHGAAPERTDRRRRGSRRAADVVA